MYFVIDIYRHFQQYPQSLEKMTSPFCIFFPINLHLYIIFRN